MFLVSSLGISFKIALINFKSFQSKLEIGLEFNQFRRTSLFFLFKNPLFQLVNFFKVAYLTVKLTFSLSNNENRASLLSGLSKRIKVWKADS